MKDKTIIIILSIILLLLVYVVFFSPTYKCESEQKIHVYCDHIDQFYGLQNGECIKDDVPNDRCTSGWEREYWR